MITAAIPGVATRLRLTLTACVALIALPHVLHLPLWVDVSAGAALAWQALAAWRGWPVPSLLVRTALTLAAFIAVVTGFGRIAGPQAGIALLLLMMLLKLCEVRRHRDVMVLLALSCFLLATQFLFSQSLAMAACLVAGAWLIVTVLVQAHTATAGGQMRMAAVEAGRLLLLAAPVAAALFMLFPRLSGPLWGLPTNAGTRAITGLSEQMSPGSIAALARSSAVAFRVRFPGGNPPPPNKRYWRGPVLWDFDHGTWRMDRAERQAPAPRIERAHGRLLRADITLTPTRRHWLVALDVPLAATADSRLDGGATLMARHAVNQRLHYVARSAVGARIQPRLDPATAARATRLPTHGNPRARALAARWAADGAEPRTIIRKALALFRTRDFHYTLTPPPTGNRNSIDAFLFQTRRGFCEHYASAFTFLMRAADLPARVVTGYQGAEHSTIGNYWIVRDSDAHAWSEVWLAGHGWLRVDPTAAVAPQRIDVGPAAALADDPALPFMARANGDIWYQARLLWDAADTGWNRWVVAYGPQLQQRFLSHLKLASSGRTLLMLALGMLGLLGAISTWFAWRMRRRSHPDRVIRCWQRISHRLARIGLGRHCSEGPLAYADRINSARPDLGPEIRTLALLYTRLRYCRDATVADRRRFLERARMFSPRRHRIRWP